MQKINWFLTYSTFHDSKFVKRSMSFSMWIFNWSFFSEFLFLLKNYLKYVSIICFNTSCIKKIRNFRLIAFIMIVNFPSVLQVFPFEFLIEFFPQFWGFHFEKFFSSLKFEMFSYFLYKKLGNLWISPLFMTVNFASAQ